MKTFICYVAMPVRMSISVFKFWFSCSCSKLVLNALAFQFPTIEINRKFLNVHTHNRHYDVDEGETFRQGEKERGRGSQLNSKLESKLRTAACTLRRLSHYHSSHKFLGAILVSSSPRAESLRPASGKRHGTSNGTASDCLKCRSFSSILTCFDRVADKL